MSDYLWDKSGEPEEDVEHLEQLLGALRYEPRPLQLPEDFSARAARNSFRPQQRPFRWQRLAVAASLLLTLLAGAWLLMSQHNKEVPQQAITAPQQIVAPQPNDSTPRNETATTNNDHEQPAPTPKETVDIKRVNYQPHQRVSSHVGAKATRHAPRALTTRPREQVATVMTPEQKQATEQLLLALRIASAKYNYAQRELQEASAMRKPETR